MLGVPLQEAVAAAQGGHVNSVREIRGVRAKDVMVEANGHRDRGSIVGGDSGGGRRSRQYGARGRGRAREGRHG